jgi:hypothetical protein
MGGTIFTVGFVSGTAASIDLLPIIVKALAHRGQQHRLGGRPGCMRPAPLPRTASCR